MARTEGSLPGLLTVTEAGAGPAALAHLRLPPRLGRHAAGAARRRDRARSASSPKAVEALLRPARPHTEGDRNDLDHLHDPGDTVEARHEKRRRAARERWPEYPASDLESGAAPTSSTGARATVRAHRHESSPPVSRSKGKDVAGFYDNGSDSSSSSGPRTPAQSPGSRRRKRRARTRNASASRRTARSSPSSHARRSGSATSTTTGRCRPSAKQPRLLLDHGCTIENQEGHLVVQDPRKLDPNGDLHVEAMKQVVRAARVLDAAGSVVLEELEKTKRPTARRTPARQARRRLRGCRHQRPALAAGPAHSNSRAQNTTVAAAADLKLRDRVQHRANALEVAQRTLRPNRP